jgi:CRISPR-associated endonuclease/helicase Cas3
MELYKYQKEIARLVRQGKNIILQAPTGAGKTMAALWPFLVGWAADSLSIPRKCVYAVPMRVLANQFEEEYKKIVYQEMLLATPPKIAKQTGEYKQDPEFFHDLTFATIDQVLSGWLLRPYSQSKRKWNLSAGALVGSYLIFDEFHLFDPDSTLPTTLQLLKTLNGISPFLLMTATFSQEMLRELAHELNAKAVLLTPDDLQEIPAQKKERFFQTVDQPLVTDEGVFIDQIIAAHQSQAVGDRRSLVVCNQVERAQRVYQALRAAMGDADIRLLHSRFLQKERQAKEDEIRREFHKDTSKHTSASMILVATQVVEVGLDISCRALHTELAPGAAVLQRAGRCARYEGETGHVYAYPVENAAPYNGKEAKEQCERAWEWLQQHEGEHLDFTQEQALINHAHGPSDKRMLAGLRGTEFDWKRQIQSLWQGEGSRGEASHLIRDVQAVSVVIHSDPEQLCPAPFDVDSFSLFPGTLQGKFEKWKAANEAIDQDWDDGRLPWLVQKLIEDDTEADAQGNQPIRYTFKSVEKKNELYAPLLVLNPELVVYSSELGLVLSPEKFDPALLASEWQESKPPSVSEKREREQYGYQKESYARHIELVYQAFAREWSGWIPAVGYGSWLEWVTAVGHRLEHKYGWQPNIVREMAQLVVCLHDVGKLSRGWQGWAQEWQRSTAVNNPLSPGEMVAHTDYDPTNALQNELNRKMGGKRPNHAVESAYASLPLLLSLLPDKDKHMPLLRAAFTAISRHHGPFTSQPDSYELSSGFGEQMQATAVNLPPSLQPLINVAKVQTKLAYDFKIQRGIDQGLLIQPDNDLDLTCYFVLVRALRFADQEGTKRGTIEATRRKLG